MLMRIFINKIVRRQNITKVYTKLINKRILYYLGIEHSKIILAVLGLQLSSFV